MGFARSGRTSRSNKSATSGRGNKNTYQGTATNRAPMAAMFTPKTHSLAPMAKFASSRDKKEPNKQGFARGILNRRA